MGFVDVTGRGSGENLSIAIKSACSQWNIDLSNCRGQCYDGAGAMAGIHKGLWAQIKRDFSKATYWHCASHALNLCLNKSLTVDCIQNAFDACGKIVRYFTFSSKREHLLIEYTSKYKNENNDHNKTFHVTDLCTTRFIERHDAIEVFLYFYAPILHCLHQIANDKSFNQNRRQKQVAIHASWNNLKLVVVLLIIKHLMQYTKPLSRSLQGRLKDIISAYLEIDHVKKCLQNIRQNVDFHHHAFYDSAISIANAVNVIPSKPRNCEKQTMRCNVPSLSIEDYWKKAVTIPYLDYIISEMGNRFDEEKRNIICGLYIVPSEINDADIEKVRPAYKWFRMIYHMLNHSFRSLKFGKLNELPTKRRKTF